jgi:hypothetical protein
MADMVTSTIKGRVTGTTGAPEDLTAANVRTIINVADGANAYVHPNHSGDVTSVADGAQTIANSAVSYAKIQNVSNTDRVLGRSTAGAGVVEEIICTASGRALIDDASVTAQRATLGVNWTHGLTIESPTAAEDVSFFFTDEAITITKMVAVLVGSATPSVTWTVKHGTDRSAAGAAVVTAGTTTTSTTTGSVVTSFNDATVVANSFLWVETTAQSGTVSSINITVFYTKD